MNSEWESLYNAAMSVIHPCDVSEHMSIGSVGAAVLTKSGRVFTGICIDTSSSLGMCAERNALSSMITAGEYEVVKVCSVYKDGSVLPPCGACREFMMQLGGDTANIEILVDDQEKVMRLSELMPNYPYR